MNKLYSFLAVLLFGCAQLMGQYCVPAHASGCGSGDRIDNFNIPSAGFSHNNTGCAPNAYGDYTSMYINLTPGTAYPFTVTHGFSSQNVKIWVDLNQDGVFTDAAPELLFTGASTGTPITTAGSITIPAGTPNGSYRMRVGDRWLSAPIPCNTDGFGETHDYSIIVGPAPTCAVPTATNTTLVTSTSATLGWTAPATPPANGYQIYYSTSPTAPTAATVPSGTSPTNSYLASPLLPSTTYYWWVRSNCSATNKSFWVSGGSFLTACVAVTALPWTENFDSMATIGAGIVPPCWKQVTGTNAWTSSNTASTTFNAPRSLPNYMRLQYGNTTASQLWTPGFNLTGGVTYEYSFWYNSGGTGPSYAGFTGTALVNNTQSMTGATTLGTFISATQAVGNYTLYKVYYTPATTGVYYFGARATATSAPWYLGLDDFKVRPAPTCLDVQGFVLTTITATSATFTWTLPTPAPAGGYDIYYSTSNVPPLPGVVLTPTNSVFVATGNTATVTPLTPNTKYFFWIRARCSATDIGDWTDGPVIYTPQIPAPWPYSEGFNTGNGNYTFIGTGNYWMVGAATGNPANSLYVTNDGTANAYNTSADTTSFAYRDISVPAGTTLAKLRFDWKSKGETGLWDYIRVFVAPTTFNPVAGTTYTNASPGITQIGGDLYNVSTWTVFNNNAVNLAPYAGQTVRLIFQWRNDGTGGTQPPGAIDNILLARCETTAPVVNFPTITHNSAVVEWPQDLGGANYELRYREVGTTNWTPWQPIAAVAFPATMQTFNLPIAGYPLLPAKNYEVEIVAICNATSGTAGLYTFTTRCDPAPVSGVVVNNITFNSAVVSWNAMAGAVNYRVEWRKQGDAWGTIPFVDVLGATTLTLPNLQPYTFYEVRVASNCSGAVNPWSPPKLFLTRPTCEMAPVGLTVNNLTLNQANVEWDAMPNATYVLRWRKVGAQSWTVVNLTTNSYLITGLTEQTQYEVQVANVCNGAQQTFTASYVFTTPTVEYCGMSSDSAAGEYISNVTVTPNGAPQMVNNSPASTYTQYVTDPKKEIILVQGSTGNTISVTKSWAGSTYDEAVAVWIDFNRNGVFEDAERIMQSAPSKVTPVTATFTVPANAFVSLTNDKYMLMRVVLSRNNFVMLCSNFDNGEVEDYKVRIVKPLLINTVNPQEVSIVPNPTKDYLQVTNVPDGSEFKVYNAAGQLTLKGNLVNNTADVRRLINGVYIFEVNKGDGTVQKKFIKQ